VPDGRRPGREAQQVAHAEIGARLEAALPPLEDATPPGEQLSEPNPDGDLVGRDVAGRI
jgi:catalase